ncbi:MAG: hypothetical protein U0936_11115 [Planctomycetaceae bacterium]
MKPFSIIRSIWGNAVQIVTWMASSVMMPFGAVDSNFTKLLQNSIVDFDVERWNQRANRFRRYSLYKLSLAFFGLILLLPMHGLWIAFGQSFRLESAIPRAFVGLICTSEFLPYPGSENEYELWRLAVLAWQLLFLVQFIAFEVPEFFSELSHIPPQIVVRAGAVFTLAGIGLVAMILWASSHPDPTHHVLADISMTGFEFGTNAIFFVAYRTLVVSSRAMQFLLLGAANLMTFIPIATLAMWMQLNHGHAEHWVCAFSSGFSAAILVMGHGVLAFAWLLTTYRRSTTAEVKPE